MLLSRINLLHEARVKGTADEVHCITQINSNGDVVERGAATSAIRDGDGVAQDRA